MANDYQLLIKHILKMPIAQASRKEIVYRGDLRFTYPEFVARVHRLAGALTALGAKPGMRIAVADWDSHRYLESYFAIPMLGCVLMMVNIRLSPAQIAYTIDHSDAEILLINKDFFPACRGIREQLTKIKKVVCLADDHAPEDGDYGEKYAGDYETLLAAAAPEYDFPEFDENTIATTFYTTGTTGEPKGVYFSHRQLVLHTLSLTSTMAMSGFNGGVSREDVYMPLTPMFHVHGWGFPFVATLMGMQQVYVGRFQPALVLKLLKAERVTTSHCVPTILHMLLNAPEAENIDFSRWRVVIGGSAMPGALCRAALARGIDAYSGYGMSESCPIMTISQITGDMVADDPSPEREVEIRCATGQAGALIELALADEDMNFLPHDGKSIGEVVARAASLTAGYVKNEAASAALWRGGWMHTGDLGSIDKFGLLHVLDRSKDVIKTGGEWISSIALEDIILRDTRISECAVVAIHDCMWGERPVAIVVHKPDAVLTEDEVKSLIRARVELGELSRYAIPDHVFFAEALEKTSVGKLDKKKLRVIYGASSS
ncbi:long-chain-fatty-acid--CoA ligase [Acidocella sp.]|jgi:fatty-acyl-CoA synthase|uniref:long-chain-fatty-acid--CoA ligase n=1 Tax=Acidocella sp. TaxID=50710 RepID=UPI002F3F9555